MLQEKKIYGLIGKNISYSFSKKYFNNKFIKTDFKHCCYKNFDLNNLENFNNIIKNNNIKGLNVTIPYKENIISLLDSLSLEATQIGAVNTIKIDSNKKLIGYNTDYIGFINSIKPLLKSKHKKAIVLGSGGASKAIIYSLNKMNISSLTVSRNKLKGDITYKQLNSQKIKECQIIINCSPVGTFPNINDYPKIPYEYINENHICYDLIYNPNETKFLLESKKRNALTINGSKMLELQAEESWKIWNT
jgi:shikimate dehydrogenase